MTVNPLVAGRLDTPVDAWSGVWIAEDIELINQGIRFGSWIDTGLGVIGAGLDALAAVSDPIGTLLQYGVAWIIEHVKPLSQALDWLAGDPGAIAGHAQTWRNVATSLHQQAQQAATSVRLDLTEWSGAASDAYRTWANEQQQAVAGLAGAAEAMALITEGAGALIAAVRLLVRDAIATCVSRLITYAAEEAATLGIATPLVVEQVSTLVASWAAKIARWLNGLLSSLRALLPTTRRLAQLIERLKQILGRLRRGESGPGRPGRNSRDQLLDELRRQGVKHNPEDMVHIGRDAEGRIVFLENGNDRAGLQHLLNRHAGDFDKVCVVRDKIGDLVFAAVTTGKQIGLQRSRPIYEVLFEGKTYRLAVSVGNNGFIVGANPVGR
ncbi:WXG100 family type VII secretion target [Plantactinospora siamensis]|uniref:WXG100 family type VII secretion target n=1 Tax=Plantactinospora siamensis TaxID=555372 RepID=A0ABV6P2D5_9ACTN